MVDRNVTDAPPEKVFEASTDCAEFILVFELTMRLLSVNVEHFYERITLPQQLLERSVKP